MNCPDCGAKVGTPHIGGCDVARCPHTGEQMLQCMGEEDVISLVTIGEDPNNYTEAQHSGTCIGQIWTGVWPGEAEAIEHGWYAKFTDKGWQTCSAEDPQGMPDLNKVAMELHWDAALQKMVD